MGTQLTTADTRVIVGEAMMDAAEARTEALSSLMQSIARNYLAARARAGEAILDSARYLAEARQAAKYGEWGIFLEATGTQEDFATRMIAIAERADADRQYALAVSDGRLAFTAAFELLNAPAQTQQQALESTAPTPASVIRKAKQETKLRTSAVFAPAPAAPFWQATYPNHATAHLWTRERPDFLRSACGQTIQNRLPSGSTEGSHCSSCVRATWPQNQTTPAAPKAAPVAPADITDEERRIAALAGYIWEGSDLIPGKQATYHFKSTGGVIDGAIMTRPQFDAWLKIHAPIERAPAALIETDDSVIIAEIRTKADALGLGVIWEDDTVILHWPEEDIDQLLGMGYQDALFWLAGEGAEQAALRAQQEEIAAANDAPPDLAYLDSTLPADLHKRGYFWKSASPPTIAHNDTWSADAPTPEQALQAARSRERAKTTLTLVLDLSAKEPSAAIPGFPTDMPTLLKSVRFLLDVTDQWSPNGQRKAAPALAVLRAVVTQAWKEST